MIWTHIKRLLGVIFPMAYCPNCGGENAFCTLCGGTGHVANSTLASWARQQSQERWQRAPVTEPLMNFKRVGGSLVPSDPASTEQIKVPCNHMDRNLPCDGFMVLRHGPRGDFFGCSNYPYCKNTCQPDEIKRTAGGKGIIERKVGVKCDRCKTGHFVPRWNKQAQKQFFGCSNYPTCASACDEITPEGKIIRHPQPRRFRYYPSGEEMRDYEDGDFYGCYGEEGDF